MIMRFGILLLTQKKTDLPNLITSSTSFPVAFAAKCIAQRLIFIHFSYLVFQFCIQIFGIFVLGVCALAFSFAPTDKLTKQWAVQTTKAKTIKTLDIETKKTHIVFSLNRNINW